MRTHNPKFARSEYPTQLAKMSFDKILDLTAGVYFNFYIIMGYGGEKRLDYSYHQPGFN